VKQPPKPDKKVPAEKKEDAKEKKA
jgi:hypothetical protein